MVQVSHFEILPSVSLLTSSVVRSGIGEIPFCLGGEVDCVQTRPGEPHPGLEGCMELKTNKVIENEKQDMIFHK